MFLTDSLGNVIYSENISLKAIATYTNSTKLENNIQLFPNPFNSVLNIQNNGILLHEMQIEINDVAGKTVLKKSFFDVHPGQKISLNMSSLKSGIYLSQISNGSRILMQSKLVK